MPRRRRTGRTVSTGATIAATLALVAFLCLASAGSAKLPDPPTKTPDDVRQHAADAQGYLRDRAEDLEPWERVGHARDAAEEAIPAAPQPDEATLPLDELRSEASAALAVLDQEVPAFEPDVSREDVCSTEALLVDPLRGLTHAPPPALACGAGEETATSRLTDDDRADTARLREHILRAAGEQAARAIERAAADDAAPPAARAPARSVHAADALRAETAPGASLPLWLAVGLALALAPLARLYRRLTRDDTLANPTRRAVLDHVAARPGATAHEVARACSINYRTAAHHLGVLHEFGALEAREVGARLRYFGNGRLSDAGKRAALALRHPQAARVVRALARDPRGSLSALAARAGLPKSTAKWHVDRLRRLGLVLPDGRPAAEAIDGALTGP
ncbi:MAG TPA: helix-turn-helix domain-containing protein [Candidatus Thermoplasmatota archaeon]|nr:helix-turn-helix domain-containing protein [Candidatus Thermoplasmatota archaeon]